MAQEKPTNLEIVITCKSPIAAMRIVETIEGYRSDLRPCHASIDEESVRQFAADIYWSENFRWEIRAAGQK